MIALCIPTIKDKVEVERDIIEPIRRIGHHFSSINIASSKSSAAVNRNEALKMARSDKNATVCVMIDDDIRGFYFNWEINLTYLVRSCLVKIAAARLITKDGNLAPQLGARAEDLKNYYPALWTRHDGQTLPIVCSAAIAFRLADGIDFDTRYVGASYEDTDFCMQYRAKYPDGLVVIEPNCKLIHLGECKGYGQGGSNVQVNKKYFAMKWGIEV